MSSDTGGEKDANALTDNWIQCDSCSKWRRVPKNIADALGDDDEWCAPAARARALRAAHRTRPPKTRPPPCPELTACRPAPPPRPTNNRHCSENPDKKLASCSVPQELTDQEIDLDLVSCQCAVKSAVSFYCYAFAPACVVSVCFAVCPVGCVLLSCACACAEERSLLRTPPLLLLQPLARPGFENGRRPRPPSDLCQHHHRRRPPTPRSSKPPPWPPRPPRPPPGAPAPASRPRRRRSRLARSYPPSGSSSPTTSSATASARCRTRTTSWSASARRRGAAATAAGPTASTACSASNAPTTFAPARTSATTSRSRASSTPSCRW
jgi:hypothetical protein